jgi:hypothetical protein
MPLLYKQTEEFIKKNKYKNRQSIEPSAVLCVKVTGVNHLDSFLEKLEMTFCV